jgi:RHS repeat-associated protein
VHDALDHTQEMRWDPAGRQTAAVDALNAVTQYGYDAAGRLGSETDPEGRRTTYGYDDAGRPARVTDGLQRTASATYDEGGLLDTSTTAAGVTSTFGWDASGLLTSVKDELGHTRSWTYDRAARVSTSRDARGDAATWGYDHAGRLASQTDADNATVGYGYDHAGRVSSITDARAKTSTIGYDPLGNIDSFTDPLDRTWSWTFDDIGRPKSSLDPKGQQVGYVYDAASRPKTTTTPVGDITYDFDAADRLKSVSDSSGTVTYGYDDADRPTGIGTAAGTVGYGYDRSGRVTNLKLPQGDVSQRYDSAGTLDRVTDWTGAWTDYDVNGDGQPTQLSRSNGVDTRYRYDETGRLDQVSHMRGDSVMVQFTYTLDADGNRTAEASNAGTTSYVVDKLNRLRSEIDPDGRTVGYTYNADGSRETRTTAAGTTTYSYDDAGQLTSTSGPAGTKSYQYDRNGNRTKAGTDTFGYDWADRMVSAATDGTQHSWTYDATGTRITADAVPQLWDRTTDNAAGVEHLVGTGTGSDSTAYLHDPFGGLSTSIRNGSTTWALGDALGSTRALTDGTGTTIGTTDYDAFGAARASTGEQSPFGFTGEQTDPGGLHFLRARSMDTSTGQFMQADTVFPGAPGVVGYNRYAYAGDNPTTWFDPTGHDTEYGSLLSGIASRLATAGRLLGRCVAGAFQEVLEGALWSTLSGGVTAAGVATDSVIGCFSAGRGHTGPPSRPAAPDVDLARPTIPGFGPNGTPARMHGPWTMDDLKRGAYGHPPRSLGSPHLHHADQMPGSGIHELPPGFHLNNRDLHPNKWNQGVTKEMRELDRELHWWYRSQEMGGWERLGHDYYYDGPAPG